MGNTVEGKVLYRTIQGFIFSGPYERKAGNKIIRDFLISTVTPEGEQVVRVTVWEEHKDMELKVGDYIIANGKYEIYPHQQDDGEYINKHSCSASKLINVGNGLGDKRAGIERAPSIQRKPKKDIDF